MIKIKNAKNIIALILAIALFVLFFLFNNKNTEKPNKVDLNNIDASNVDLNNISLNAALINSGLLDRDIYSGNRRVNEVISVINKKFETPDDYEIAIEKDYVINDDVYQIKVLRQNDLKVCPQEYKEYLNSLYLIPDKPLLIVFTKNNFIKNLFIVSSYSVLRGSDGYCDYDIEKIKDSIEMKDLDGDGVSEILLNTFKSYVIEKDYGLITFYFDKLDNKFKFSNDIFYSSTKEYFELLNVDDNYYVIKADPGSSPCRLCSGPYLVRIYKFNDKEYIDIGSVGSDEEFTYGFEATNNAIPKVKEKILTNNVIIY